MADGTTAVQGAARPIKLIRWSFLDLDPRNPRLLVDGEPTQQQLVSLLYNEEGVDELVPSLLENGYFGEEPLVVVPKGKRFTVVEGNRRTAALKLLHDDDLRRALRVSGWPQMSKAQRQRLTMIPCVVYSNRDDVLPFLGFRHITGAKKWAPFQKARFVAQLVEAGESLGHIEEIIGDDTSATKKLYQEFIVFKQLTDDLGMPPDLIRERFSLLEVMLGQRPIKKYLGMSHALPVEKVDSVVPEDRLERLAEVTTWVFGTKEKREVISESRDINRKLAPVIANDQAREHLQRTGDLDGAYDRTDGEQQFLIRRLNALERGLADVAGILPLHSGAGGVAEAVKRVATLAASLQKQIK